MALIEKGITAFTAFWCWFFDVTPDSLRNGRRGNLPPESGGFSAY